MAGPAGLAETARSHNWKASRKWADELFSFVIHQQEAAAARQPVLARVELGVGSTECHPEFDLGYCEVY